MDFKYLCRTCRRQGTFRDGSPGCAKFNIKVNPEEDFCAWHDSEDTPICAFCEETEGLLLINFYDNWHYICQNHFSVLYTCQTCDWSAQCGFHNDPNGQPYIVQQVRQGNMIIQQQVKNPEMISQHCTTCHCSFGDKNDCLKESYPNEKGCPNWQLRKELLQ
jgi:hypothetical protein